MFLKSLEAQGFKSFPDKTLLTFEKGITGVVGPNGSGKSNISDAIRWVLGEQSNKQLRGEKSEDVVFNGTASRKPQGMAQVTLCLDNGDRVLNCDSDEVFVTRRFYRSGESEYQINHATVRLKDVNELFMDTGLGRDGYSMIGQGKISDIVSRRSDDRRDMFEEAAGISRFRYRKTEAERKLNATEENLIRLRDIMDELTQRVGPLEDQCKKAKKYLEYAGEEKNLEIGLWLITLEKSREKLKEQEHKIDLVQGQYEQVRDRIDEIIDLLEQKGGQTRLLTVQMDNSRRAIAEAEEASARTEGQIAVCENNIFHNNENINRITGELSSSSTSGGSIDGEIENKQKLLEEKNEEITTKRSLLEESAKELEALLTATAEEAKKLDAVSSEINMINSALADYSLKNVTAISSINEIKNRGDSVDSALCEREERITALENEREELKNDLNRCDGRIEECSNAIHGSQMLMNSAEQKLKEATEKVTQLELDRATKLRRASLLTDMENSLDGFNNTVKTVVTQASKGILGGIKGPVSRLISVPEKYAVAIEVALGAAVQNIVTATENDAKKAIQYLKQNKQGRATFLPLSNIKPRKLNADGIDDCAGFEGVASKLVSCSAEYNDIISYLLGGIAVADSIDSAAAIARRFGYRFKIVTLDGQTVNTGGSLTGGSFNRSVGLLSRSGEIEKLKADAEKIKADIDTAKQLSDKQKSQLDSRRAAIESARAEQITANEDKIRVLGELKRVDDAIKAAKSDFEQLKGERENSAARISELEKSSRDAQAAAEKLKQQLKASTENREAVGAQQEKLSVRREELLMHNSTVRVTIVSLEKEADAIRLDIQTLISQKAEALTRADALKVQIESLEKANEDENNAINGLKTQITAYAEKVKNQNELISSRQKQRTELETEISSLTAEERNLSSQKEKLGGESVRLQERRDAITKEYDEVVAKLFDKYELTRSAAEALEIKISDPTESGKRLRELKAKIKALGSINLEAIEEYEQVSERYVFMKVQLGDIETAKKELEELIMQLTGSMQSAFSQKFREIADHFSKTFVELFGGGVGKLELSDPTDVLNSGIEIKVQPPGKNVSSIEQLSGGEKSIVALAIYFAMMKVSPPPFCMLDEVESALDDVNVDRFAAYIRRMCGNTQFIVVTHRRGTMEEADVLYGVTMQEKGVSKILKLDSAEK